MDPSTLYEHSPSDPHALAMAFLEPQGQAVPYPFKFKHFHDHQVRVKVTYCGVCQSDCAKVRGTWKKKQQLIIPSKFKDIPHVSKVGEKVKNFKEGDVVVAAPIKGSCRECHECLKGNSNLCAGRVSFFNPEFGAFCTHFQIDESMLYKVPDNFDVKRGAPLMCAGITVFAPLKRFSKSGMRCAVVSIGGLGHLALLMASKMGMEGDELKQLGAKYIKSSIDKKSLKEEEGGYDLVICNSYAGDEELFELYVRLTAVQGTFVQVGIPAAGVKLRLDVGYIAMKAIRVTGSIIGNEKEVEDMLVFCSEHSVYPIVEEFGFGEVNEAFRRCEKQQARYRLVVNVEQWSKEHGFWDI